jgi:putative transposase
MDERMRFVIRLKDGESMACLYREFGISRNTGYKILDRYQECGWSVTYVCVPIGHRKQW